MSRDIRISLEAFVAGLLALLAAGAVAVMWSPVGNRVLRVLFLGLCALLWLGTGFLLRRRRRLAAGYLMISAVVPAGLMLPGAAVDPVTLRTAYLERLRAYEGTPYVWGGENSSGIDCSGLVRGALRDVCLMEGLKSWNPRLVRAGVRLWWDDCSARALGEGYGGYARLITRGTSINQMVHDVLVPGDIAVTENGVHTLGYLGENRWIQADPGGGLVRASTIPEATFWYRDVPVKVLRWTMLIP